jgi:hypothetical protein
MFILFDNKWNHKVYNNSEIKPEDKQEIFINEKNFRVSDDIGLSTWKKGNKKLHNR